MTRERAYYIAYEIVVFIACCEQQKAFENYELCMYVADLADVILTGDYEYIKSYKERLIEEWKYASDKAWRDEAARMILLLDEVFGIFGGFINEADCDG